MAKKIIYSALVGNYDNFPNHFVVKDADWEHILFTDVNFSNDTTNGWVIKPLVHVIKGDNVKTARWHKLNSHLLFDDCEFSVWIDSNVKILDEYIYTRSQHLFNKGVSIASVKHPERDCIYDEAEKCLALGKDKKKNIELVTDLLKRENYPRNNGLFESNLLFRNHTHQLIIDFNSLWWFYLNKYSRRDQLTMCFVLWKKEIKCQVFFEDVNVSTRNSIHFKYNQNHKIQNDYVEVSKQDIIDRDTLIHEKNLKINSQNELLIQKDQESQHYSSLLVQKEQESQHYSSLLVQKEQESQHFLNLFENKNKENQYHINLIHELNNAHRNKIKRIKRTISYKLFFKIEIFIKELISNLFK